MIAYNFIIFIVILLQALLPSSAVDENTNRYCHRDWPAPGVWKHEAPYWQSLKCPNNQAFGKIETEKCLKNRTVYVIGNSVARQAAFGFVEMLGGDTVKRENQRDMCPKHETTWGDSCHQEFAGVKFKYLFLQFMDGFNYTDRHGFPFFRQKNVDTDELYTGKLHSECDIFGSCSNVSSVAVTPDYFTPGSFWADDNCMLQNTRQCLREFFIDSKSEDILIFTLGMSYQKELDTAKLAANSLDTRSWLMSSAANFKAHIAATFKGQTFRVTLAPLNPTGYVAYLTPIMHQVNLILWSLWQPGSEDKPWYTIDQWAINSNREYLYNDHVHFNGMLTHAMLHQVLNELCPGGGIAGSNRWPRPDFAGKYILVKTMNGNSSRSSMNEYYCVATTGDEIGTLYRIEANPTSNVTTSSIPGIDIPLILKDKQLTLMTSNEVSQILLSKNTIPYLTQGQLIKGTASKTVYLLANDGKKHAFLSSTAFLEKGYDFGNVITLQQSIIAFITTGSDIS